MDIEKSKKLELIYNRGRMEIRKVQTTGGSSYIITLPKTWVKKLNIKKNDPLGLVVQPDGSLVITKNVGEEQEERVMEIDVAGVDTETYLFRCLIGAYIAGYNAIKIKSKSTIPPFVRAVVMKFTQATIGQEVVEETDNSIIIKDLLNPAEMPFERSIRRMYTIARGMHRDAISMLRNRNKMLAEDISHRDNDVDKLYWLIAAAQHGIDKCKSCEKNGSFCRRRCELFSDKQDYRAHRRPCG